ncbi:MAG TPA: hypothetical protein VFD71_03170 [Planctomycetota bacterium]|jgi:hypothetical protein|nr:hypothetical protein [Planctomycetota bacterium]
MSPSSDNGGRPHEAWSAREWSPLGERSPGGRSPTSDGPGTSLLPSEMGAALERQLLLADGASDVKERARPSGSRRAPWVAAITVVLVAGTVLTVWHLRERKTWMDTAAGLETALAQLRSQTKQEIDALRNQNDTKERWLSERKADNQSLAALLDKSLLQLKANQEDLRRERERNEKLAASYEQALARSASPIRDAFGTWMKSWLPISSK